MGTIPPDKLAIGKALLAGGPITQEHLQRELDLAQKSGSVLGKALLQSGFPTEEELIYPLLARLRIPKINARKTSIPLETIRLIPEELARKHKVLPLDQIGGILVVVMPDIALEAALDEVRKHTGMFVTPIQCTPEGFDEILGEYYQKLAASGLGVAPAANAAAAVATATVAAAPANGAQPASAALQAIPAGSTDEDGFFKRYMTGGPVPAEEQVL